MRRLLVLVLAVSVVFAASTHPIEEITPVDTNLDMSSFDIIDVDNVRFSESTDGYTHFSENVQGDGFSIVFDGTGGDDANYLYIRGGAGNPSAQSNLFRITRDTGSINMYGSLAVTTGVTVGDGLTVSAGNVILPANSVDSGEVNFNYATSGSKGGDATGLACTNCVSLLSETDGYYASSSSEAGPAIDLDCNDCVALGTETVGVYAASNAEEGPATGLVCDGGNCVTLKDETSGNYAGSGSEGGAATNTNACSGDTVCEVDNTISSSSANLILSGSGWGMNFYIDTDAESNDDYNFYSDGVNIFNIDGNSGDTQSDGSVLVYGEQVYSDEFADYSYDVRFDGSKDTSWLYIKNKADTSYKGVAASRVSATGNVDVFTGSYSADTWLHVRQTSSAIKLGDSTSSFSGIRFDDDTENSGVRLVWDSPTNQLRIESTSNVLGSAGTSQFIYDRDGNYFQFNGNLGVVAAPSSSWGLIVGASTYVSGNFYVDGIVGADVSPPTYTLDIGDSAYVSGGVLLAGGLSTIIDIEGDENYMDIEGTRFGYSTCNSAMRGALKFNAICFSDTLFFELQACRYHGSYGWVDLDSWQQTVYAC